MTHQHESCTGIANELSKRRYFLTAKGMIEVMVGKKKTIFLPQPYTSPHYYFQDKVLAKFLPSLIRITNANHNPQGFLK